MRPPLWAIPAVAIPVIAMVVLCGFWRSSREYELARNRILLGKIEARNGELRALVGDLAVIDEARRRVAEAERTLEGLRIRHPEEARTVSGLRQSLPERGVLLDLAPAVAR